MATAETPGVYSITLSTRRKGNLNQEKRWMWISSTFRKQTGEEEKNAESTCGVKCHESGWYQWLLEMPDTLQSAHYQGRKLKRIENQKGKTKLKLVLNSIGVSCLGASAASEEQNVVVLLNEGWDLVLGNLRSGNLGWKEIDLGLEGSVTGESNALEKADAAICFQVWNEESHQSLQLKSELLNVNAIAIPGWR